MSDGWLGVRDDPFSLRRLEFHTADQTRPKGQVPSDFNLQSINTSLKKELPNKADSVFISHCFSMRFCESAAVCNVCSDVHEYAQKNA